MSSPFVPNDSPDTGMYERQYSPEQIERELEKLKSPYNPDPYYPDPYTSLP